MIFNRINHISDTIISHQIASLKLWGSFLIFFLESNRFPEAPASNRKLFYNQKASPNLSEISRLKSKSQYTMLMAPAGFRAPEMQFDCRLCSLELIGVPAVRFDS
jgi:hypothetical protein